ncbi:hypothetical protein P389DRAFT_194584 [Cystobasidium minutum MCA 4210]|uniref:uncharacterized protein n=1 Tax=Cystobasidium minutum MCA 4210 TaxID=1397322 RepID=UPI0034CF239E|eukprot:jgi/Rhomi1/194584/gm1.2798_g
MASEAEIQLLDARDASASSFNTTTATSPRAERITAASSQTPDHNVGPPSTSAAPDGDIDSSSPSQRKTIGEIPEADIKRLQQDIKDGKRDLKTIESEEKLNAQAYKAIPAYVKFYAKKSNRLLKTEYKILKERDSAVAERNKVKQTVQALENDKPVTSNKQILKAQKALEKASDRVSSAEEPLEIVTLRRLMAEMSTSEAQRMTDRFRTEFRQQAVDREARRIAALTKIRYAESVLLKVKLNSDLKKKKPFVFF